MAFDVLAVFTSGYAAARRSGLLDTGFGRWLFTSAYFGYKRWLEDPFAGLIRRHPELFRGGNILDVGANIGYCSVLFASALDAGRKVFAFEPEAFNAGLLKQVTEKHAAGKVVTVEAAVGDHEGQIALELNPRHHGDHRVVASEEQKKTAGKSIAVPLMSVDGFLERQGAQTPVCFMKVDVQGYELAVCEGSRRTLERNPDCAVVLEYMPEALEALGFVPADLPAWFEKRGYRCYAIGKHGELAEGVPYELGPRGYTDLLFRRRNIAERGGREAGMVVAEF